MSGHSKWSKIKHKKGAADASRGKLFAKLAKEIFVAAKSGDADPENNATLRLAIDKAKAQSMPKDNINRAIERAKGSSSSERYEEIVYEGYGAHGVAIMAYCLTDNRNRTAGSVKASFSKRGGNLGADGSVSYLFSKQGIIIIDKDEITVDVYTFEEKVIDFDIEDFLDEDETITLYCTPEKLIELKECIDSLNIVKSYIKAEVTMEPSVKIDLEEEQAHSVLNLIDDLEENDDVQDVYHNLK